MPLNPLSVSSAELQAWLDSVPNDSPPTPEQQPTSATNSALQALNAHAMHSLFTSVSTTEPSVAPSPLYSSGKNQASLDTPFYYLMWPDNTPVQPTKRLGLYETAVMEAEKFSKKYSRSVYILKCVGAMIFEGPKLKEHSEDDDNAF